MGQDASCFEHSIQFIEITNVLDNDMQEGKELIL